MKETVFVIILVIVVAVAAFFAITVEKFKWEMYGGDDLSQRIIVLEKKVDSLEKCNNVIIDKVVR